MTKALIIEDEKPAARRLQRMVEEIGFEVITLLHSVKQTIEWFENNALPDLIFLDIQLSDGLSFEIFDKLKINTPIIFTTAYDSYAIKAFKLNSIDYLLKPIDQDELFQSVEKFRKRIQPVQQDITNEIEQLKNFLFQNKVYKDRFTVNVGNSIKLLEVSEIECIASNERASYAFTFSGKMFLMDGSLDAIFEQLNPKSFFKVNRKQIVNLHGINEIIAYSNSRLLLRLKNYKEEEIVVSREKVKEFKEWLDS